jgi:mRNA interferase RelE/StbE
MRSIHFTPKAAKQYQKLDIATQKIIKKKMIEFSSFENPFDHAKKLESFDYWEYRFRIGDYRVICDQDEQRQIIIIALVWHRREIYR